MNETLLKILEKSLKIAENTGEFVIEQGGDLLFEFFTWHTISHGIGALVGLAVLWLGFHLPTYWGSKEKPEEIKQREREVEQLEAALSNYFDRVNKMKAEGKEDKVWKLHKPSRIDFFSCRDYHLPIQKFGRWYCQDGIWATILVRAIGFLLGVTIFIFQVKKFLYVMVAPKLYLIEYLLKLKETA